MTSVSPRAEVRKANRSRGVATSLICIALAACGGGGAAIPKGAPPVTPTQATAYGTISFEIPPQSDAAQAFRRAEYISPGTTRAAVFIDGATAPAGSITTCTATVSTGAGCTITWTAAVSVPASHTFAVEIDNGNGTSGKVLAENEAPYALVSGNNGALAPLTLNGVAAVGASSFETCTTTTCSGSLFVIDPASYAITNTTSPLATGFDNGPLTLASTATAVGTVSAPAGGTVTVPSAAGSVPYTVGCATSGSFFLTLAPHSTMGSGDITSAELANRALTYPAAITYGKTYACVGNAIYNAAYVGTNSATASVRIYTSTGAATAQATITGTNTGLNSPQGVSVDGSGRIFVANAGNSVTVYAPNQSGTTNATPTGTITGTNTGMNGSQGIAEDLYGRIYVANNAGKSITVYAPNPVGTINEAPIETIKGGSTTLVNPVGVALDANGLIYVADAGGTDISIFPAYTTGGTVTSAPLATISGANTLLSNPNGVALDASGRIYVADYGSNTITIYAAYTGAALGNVAPLAKIVGAATGLLTPTGVSVDATGRIYVANYNSGGAGTVTLYAAYTGAALGNVAPLASITGLGIVWGITVH